MDWKSAVKAIAPMLGAALGGPLGGVAGAAVAKALGAPNADPLEVQLAVAQATPDQVAALKRAEQDFAVAMAKLGYDNAEALERLATEDRRSARAREIALRDWMPRALGGLVALGWLGVQAYLLCRDVPAGTREMVLRMLGTLDGALMLVLGYYFGSSAGSARKDLRSGGAA